MTKKFFINGLVSALLILKKGVMSLFGCALILPVAIIMPRRRDVIAVIGKHGGKFIDNGKYFFLQAAPLLEKKVTVVFITDKRSVYEQLSVINSPYDVMYYPSAKCVWFLLRAGTVVFDSSGWYTKLRGHLLIRAKLVQLWHGVGFKKLTKHGRWSSSTSEGKAKRFIKSLYITVTTALSGGRFNYNLMTTTSNFYQTHVFEECMSSDEFLVTGYPRNTFGKAPGMLPDLVMKNVDLVALDHLSKRPGMKIVIIAPTLRPDNTLPMDLDHSTLVCLDAFARKYKIIFLVKLHPVMVAPPKIFSNNIIFVDPVSDIYPLMAVSSSLITDYSSIYMDYLMLDKPVHFYVPNLGSHRGDIGDLQLDFDEMTPGPKLCTWDETMESLVTQWNKDEYADRRSELRELAFDNLAQDEAVPKIINFLYKKKFLLDCKKYDSSHQA